VLTSLDCDWATVFAFALGADTLNDFKEWGLMSRLFEQNLTSENLIQNGRKKKSILKLPNKE
jgi:hypothetical protein